MKVKVRLPLLIAGQQLGLNDLIIRSCCKIIEYCVSMNNISNAEGYILMGLQMAVNTVSTIIFKLQSMIEVDGEQKFNHPFMQTYTMFIGEALCYLIFLAHKIKNKNKYELDLEIAKQEGMETKISLLVVLVPTICDLVGSCLAFFALSLMPSSVYQMFRGATIVITAILQVIFLKRVPSRVQLIGMVLVVVGNIIVGVTVYLNSHASGSLGFGIILLCLSFVVFSFQAILEEKYFGKYYLNPFELVGLEGCWGILLMTGLVTGLNFIPCPSQIASECPMDSMGNHFMERPLEYLKTVFDFGPDYQPELFLAILGGLISILFLNSISMAVIKYLSALTRNVIQVSTITFVWLTTMIIGWEKFYWGQLVGFLILVVGSLIYNKIIDITKYLNSHVADESQERSTDEQQSMQKLVEEPR